MSAKDKDAKPDVRSPLGVAPSDEKPEGWCEVVCVIPELRTKKRLSGGKFVDRPTSGNFSCNFSSRSIEFEIDCTSKQKKPLKYVYNVKKLPDDIVADECKAKVRDGKVILQLKKADSRSWQRELSANGLDQYIDEEEELELEKGE